MKLKISIIILLICNIIAMGWYTNRHISEHRITIGELYKEKSFSDAELTEVRNEYLQVVQERSQKLEEVLTQYKDLKQQLSNQQ